mmetsp:Transcript_12294/g.37128  ORF Transcript_12294/g.37128 Transcript_12294/m.37128 type:complete len:276 (+) Transcript_12294:3591-4418(+)
MADWWSFGIFVYEMLHATTPFYRPHTRALYKAICRDKPRFPPDVFSTDAARLLQALLTKDPNRRPEADKIKRARFFADVDFDRLLKKLVTPPFAPQVDHDADTRYVPHNLARDDEKNKDLLASNASIVTKDMHLQQRRQQRRRQSDSHHQTYPRGRDGGRGGTKGEARRNGEARGGGTNGAPQANTTKAGGGAAKQTTNYASWLLGGGATPSSPSSGNESPSYLTRSVSRRSVWQGFEYAEKDTPPPTPPSPADASSPPAEAAAAAPAPAAAAQA